MVELIPDYTDPQAQLDVMNAIDQPFTAPREGFNPLTDSDSDIEAVGFPPRPDEQTQGELRTLWEQVFTRPLQLEPATFLPPAYARPPAGNSGSLGAPFGRTHHESSLNWSGAYITPHDGEMFTQVVAQWQVPTVSPAPDGSPTAPYGSSTWIGVDGQRGYFHSSLPQIGTAQYLNLHGVLGPTYEAWVQWWPYCPATLPLTIAGDHTVLAWLYVWSLTEVRFVLVNLSTLRYTPWRLFAPSGRMLPQVPVDRQFNVSGATAEWIVERPALCPNPDLMSLPHFPPVTFDHCFAVSRLNPGPFGTLNRLVSPRLIGMYKLDDNPRSAITLTKATRPDTVDLRTARVEYQT
jgi:hypothetical protein